MGNRKALRAKELKEARAAKSYAILRNCPISPRKTRLVADMIRGMEVNRALAVLRYSPQGSTPHIEKLLISALANWSQKHDEASVEDHRLCVKTIMVDGGRSLKRMRPRAQGRAFRILKRSCHIYLEVDEMPEIESKKPWRGNKPEKDKTVEREVTE